MRRRIFLSPPALLAGLLLLLVPSPVRAHRLVVDYLVLPGHKIQVEGWYNSPANPHPATQAKVQVRRPDGSTLAAGDLDAKGFFTFAYERAETLTIVVSPTGHRGERTIPGEELGAVESGAVVPEAPGDRSAGARAWEASTRDHAQQVLIGVGFLLALAAFVMSLRNARTLRRIEEGHKDPRNQASRERERPE